MEVLDGWRFEKNMLMKTWARNSSLKRKFCCKKKIDKKGECVPKNKKKLSEQTKGGKTRFLFIAFRPALELPKGFSQMASFVDNL